MLSRWSGVDNGNVPGEVAMTDVTPTARAAAWLSCLGDALAAPDIGAAAALFGSECYWRDLLTFTWNIKTMEGHEAIIRMLEATLAATAPSKRGSPSRPGSRAARVICGCVATEAGPSSRR